MQAGGRSVAPRLRPKRARRVGRGRRCRVRDCTTSRSAGCDASHGRLRIDVRGEEGASGAALRRGHHRRRPQRPRSAPRTWRGPACKTLVLERRHVLGGAAVTEEIVPGFRFSRRLATSSACCGRRSSASCDLPEHGLDILPLDGTFTPLRPGEGPTAGGGDYLWRVNDHGRTIRELRRWSASDAEAYEEYGQLMVEMARFIKPILAIVPPDPTGIDPRAAAAAGRPGPHASAAAASASRRSSSSS